MIELILAASMAASTLTPIPATPGGLREAGFGVAAELFVKGEGKEQITVICDATGCYLSAPLDNSKKGVTF